MKKIDWKQLRPYILAIVTFIIVGAVYFSPALKGKVLNQHDIIQGAGANQEIIDYNNNNDNVVLWTNSMFSGMPTYQIACKYWSNFQTKVRKIVHLWIPKPFSYFLLYTVGFFILLLAFGVNPYLSIIGALAFAFSSYNFIIIEAGHIWKVRTIALIPPALAGFILIFRQKYKIGMIVTILFLSLQIFSNHFQMTYYMFLMLGVYFIYELYEHYKDKEIKTYLIKAGFSVAAILLAIGVNADRLWTTYEYSKYTIRGESELTLNENNKSSGLDKSYITKWSYGIEETLTLLIPNAKGGASGYIKDNEKALNKIDRRYRKQIGNQSHYWGNQPMTSGPVYLGAFIVFLFILGMFILKWRIKWFFLIATIFAIMLSWGKNFMPLTELFIDYFPMYNKFRAVASILIIAQVTVATFAFITLNEIIKNPKILNFKSKQFLWPVGLTVGLSLFLVLFPGILNFLSERELNYFNGLMSKNPQQAAGITEFIANLKEVRISIFRADALRSIFYVSAGILVLWFYSTSKLKMQNTLILLGIIVLVDMFSLDKRYLNNEDFVSERKKENTFTKNKADKIILEDEDPHYRVLNISRSTFNETYTSYFHKSIGGYHGAKLKRYQELIEYQIQNDINKMMNILKNNPATVNTAFSGLNALNMLNTKYLIYNPERAPIRNNYNFGNAWFVDNIEIVPNADEEILSLDKHNLTKTLVLDERFKSKVAGADLSRDTASYINLTNYSPNALSYESNSLSKKVAVFSEIYYPKGWNAYIDGKKAEIIRGNYLLRCLVIPEGQHKIEFKFKPQSYFAGKRISQISVVLFIVLSSFFIFIQYKNSKTINE